MNFTRREALITTALGGFVLPFAEWRFLSGRPEPLLLASRAPLPPPFVSRLPILPVAKAVSPGHYELTQRPGAREILPGLRTNVWGYEGMFPGPTIRARRGEPVTLRIKNELTVPTVTHLHGGVTPPDSDGYPTDLLLPSNAVHAMHHMHDPLSKPITGSRDYVYPNDQPAATLWYHDHRMDFTAPQVWRGLAGFYILTDAAEDALRLPRGEKDVELMICDRSFDTDGSFLYPSLDPTLLSHPGVEPRYMGGVLGDVILVNGAPWPVFEVANTRYRFRLLNASNARRYALTLDPAPNGPAFQQIGSDAGLLAKPVSRRVIQIAPAERFDVVIDFSSFAQGTTILLRNREGTGTAANVMCFRVTRNETDQSQVPQTLRVETLPDASAAVLTRNFDLSYGSSGDHGGHGWFVNGKEFDPTRMDARPKLGSTELWRIKTDFHHPFHMHLAHFRVLSHSGRPSQFDSGWKDTVDLGPGQAATLLVRFDGYRGRYVFHCHNLEHEDMAMMANFEVV